jgi:predicted O-linked N-acetylglucosamine transferase (SPINDLY family)
MSIDKRKIFELIQEGNVARALQILRKATKTCLHDPDLFYLLGLTHLRSGDAEQAIRDLRKTVELQPAYADAWSQLGKTYQSAGDHKSAIAVYRQATAALPQVVHFALASGALLHAQGQCAEAIRCYRAALPAHPNSPELHYNLGTAYSALGAQFSAAQHLRRAAQLSPKAAIVHHNLGGVLMHLGELDSASVHFREAIRLDPGLADACVGLGSVLQKLGHPDKALQQYEDTMRRFPENRAAQHCYLMGLNYVPGLRKAFIAAEHRKWGNAYSRQNGISRKHTNEPAPDRMIRVGYVSPDFADHPVGYFLEAALRHHRKGDVSIYCYSDTQAPDAVTRQLKEFAQSWRDTAFLSDEQFISLVLNDQIDVLVDLAGHTQGSRLSAFVKKPAPVQITYLGYPNTTGLPEMDYRISDRIADPPESEHCYTEELLYLDNGFTCFRPPRNSLDISALPAQAKKFVTFGSLNNTVRFTDEVLNIWCDVLREVPHSRLLLYRNTIKGTLRKRLASRFESQGFGAQRIILADSAPTPENHLSMYRHIDIALDTFPWSGHTTACQAMWMGVPVVTLECEAFAGRMVSSVCRQLGLKEFVAHSMRQYVSVAAGLGGDIGRLADLRKTLRETMRQSALCNGPLFSRNLEKVYRQAWCDWCARQ